MRRAALAAALAVSACGHPLHPSDFAGTGPELRPEQWFGGRVTSFGTFEGDDGPDARFTTESTGHRLPDGALVMDQTVHMGDGSTVHRVWTLRRAGDHGYEATAEPVAGVARGEAYGRAFHWAYDYDLTPGTWFRRVHFDHWMYLSDDGKTLLNTFVVSKLGIAVARASEIFQHPEAAP